MSRKGRTTTEIEIFGSVYHVRAQEDSERLRELASLVDAKMREVQTHSATVDSAKIAVLAALNLADELFRCRKGQDGERVEIQEKVEELAGELERALSDHEGAGVTT